MSAQDDRRLAKLRREIDDLSARLDAKYAERDAIFVRLHGEGETFQAIGDKSGVSKVCVRMKILRAAEVKEGLQDAQAGVKVGAGG